MFGDDDPEDGWNDDDPFDVKLALLWRWAPSIVVEYRSRGGTPRVVGRVTDALERLDGLDTPDRLDTVAVIALRAVLLELRWLVE